MSGAKKITERRAARSVVLEKATAVPKARTPERGKRASAKEAATAKEVALQEWRAKVEKRINRLSKDVKVALERLALANVEGRVSLLEERTETITDNLPALVRWAFGAERQLRELDHAYRNHSKAIGCNDPGAYEGPGLPSSLGVLVDRGGAAPVDGNAAAVMKRGR